MEALRKQLRRGATQLYANAFARYVLVGGTSAAVYLIASTLLDAVQMPLWFSSGAARLLAIGVAFYGHVFFTFQLLRFDGPMVLKFALSRLLLIVYAIVLTYLVVDGLGAAYWVAAWSVAISTPLIAWPMKRYWVFVTH